ncbi:aminopeptidase [uncultured Clostridium sp.]|uniref:aminopeptidase n=1 Tax=uncultured Clostridium sp. TaxID=59620 RepID=UPI0032169EAE
MSNISNLQQVKEVSLINTNDKKYLAFFKQMGEKLYHVCSLEEKLNDEYFKEKDFDELLKENHEIYSDLVGDNYKTSYGNPDYVVKELGKEMGQVATYLYNRLQGVISLVFSHKTEKIEKLLQLLIDSYAHVVKCGDNANGLIEIIRDFEVSILDMEAEEKVNNIALDTKSYYRSIVNEANPADLRYLFKYGKYITDNEIKTAKFLSTCKDVNRIAYTMVKGYMDSFIREKKDYTIKSTVMVRYYIGQEAIMREVIKEFGKYNLTPVLTRVESTDVNKQFTYDHRFDNALFFNKSFAETKEEKYVATFERYKEGLSKYSGVAVFEAFGEVPFAPESKNTALKLSEEQSKIYQNSIVRLRTIQDKYMPSRETTFTIIAFPTPEIGDNFEEIFADTMEINTLDSDKWERIQNEIIKALDKGDFIHVKGCNGNRTDIKVKMQEISNPEKETNFENCVATVNIPVGEVFTSPELKGTNGTLHLEEIFLDGLKYINLELVFKDGYIDKYNCSNFEEESKNKKYIEENLLFPNKTLPLGEFAIGTNTLAYVIAQKHNIVPILPILIGEKMGPHFAVGDTCYSYSEDERVYNPFDGKEIIAKDNEKSILRKTDIENAYTQCHTDITIPYDSLEFINAITKDGQVIEVIKGGRFILKGTEELNEPFNTDNK